MDRLIQKTIDTGRSIGTLDGALRALHGSKEAAELGQGLEQKIGAAGFLRLIEANGTIVELLSIMQHASPELAGDLLEAVEAEGVKRLIQKTIAAGRSIGTLHLTLRELRGSEETVGWDS